MQQTVLAAGGHHAVGLVRAFGDKVVNERADIAVAAAEDERLAPEYPERRVDARDEALHRRLLISGGAVELPRAVQAGYFFALKRRVKLRRVDAVIFYRVGAAGHFGPLQAGDSVQHLDLHLFGQRRGEALDIQLLRVEPHRLDKELVPRFVGKGHDLRLDARAVARADALDDAGVYRAAVKVAADDLMCALVCVGEVTDRAVIRNFISREGEGLGLSVAGLELHL